ncbi:MAG: hypothetical protein ACLTTW_04115 [Coprobacter sp.]
MDTEDAVVKSLKAGLNMQFYDFLMMIFKKLLSKQLKTERWMKQFSIVGLPMY